VAASRQSLRLSASGYGLGLTYPLAAIAAQREPVDTTRIGKSKTMMISDIELDAGD
jgi:hypothetical protein